MKKTALMMGAASIAFAAGSSGSAEEQEFVQTPPIDAAYGLHSKSHHWDFSFPRSLVSSTATTVVSFHSPGPRYLDQIERVLEYLEQNSDDFDPDTKSAISKNLWSLYD